METTVSFFAHDTAVVDDASPKPAGSAYILDRAAPLTRERGTMMPGQHQDKSKDGKHKVTIGSADDKKRGAAAFVSQQDNKGNKLTTVYDKRGNVVKEVEKKKSK